MRRQNVKLITALFDAPDKKPRTRKRPPRKKRSTPPLPTTEGRPKKNWVAKITAKKKKRKPVMATKGTSREVLRRKLLGMSDAQLAIYAQNRKHGWVQREAMRILRSR